MIIEKISVSSINPAPYNPRKDLQPDDIEYQKLKKSIEEFDIVEPLIWNKQTGNLVGGHQRLKVLIEQGITEVDVSVVDLPDTKEKALNIALNKISGEWDFPKLKDLLLELDTGEFDIGITGFDEKEIEDLMNQLFVPDENEKDDDVPEVPEEPITKKGDLYKLGEHRLLCGDATIIDDVEKLMDGQKADMVFTDPPYGMNLNVEIWNTPAKKGQWVSNKKDYKPIIGDDKQYNPEHILSFFTCDEIILWGADYYAEYLPKNGSWFVWDKRAGGLEDVQWSTSEFELCWSKKKHHRQIARIRWMGVHGMETQDTNKRIHPTQKPIELCNWFISKFSNKENLIIDLFGGSGSTLIACEKLNRKCFMMEIDEKYCDVIVKRFEDYTGKKAELLNGRT